MQKNYGRCAETMQKGAEQMRKRYERGVGMVRKCKRLAMVRRDAEKCIRNAKLIQKRCERDVVDIEKV